MKRRNREDIRSGLQLRSRWSCARSGGLPQSRAHNWRGSQPVQAGPGRANPLTGGTSSEGRISGYVLKLLREALPRTQQDLAEALGVQAATIQGWESGRRPVMSMPAGNFVALQVRLRRMGAPPALLGALTLAVEADLFLGQVLATTEHETTPADHLLGASVITRLFTGLVGWPLGGQAPAELAWLTPPLGSRRGPVPDRPALGGDERAHIVAHLQSIAEQADRRTDAGLLLIRQAYYLLSFDISTQSTDWLEHAHRTDRRLVHPGKGWSTG
jgi:transcriptional regulator with XRE-family HTH domain